MSARFLPGCGTGLAVVIFGFAIGRFAIAIREFTQAQGHPQRTGGLSVWLGVVAIITGIVLAFAGLNRYRRTRAQLESGRFEPAGSVIDLVATFTVVFGLALAAYLIYVQQNLH